VGVTVGENVGENDGEEVGYGVGSAIRLVGDHSIRQAVTKGYTKFKGEREMLPEMYTVAVIFSK